MTPIDALFSDDEMDAEYTELDAERRLREYYEKQYIAQQRRVQAYCERMIQRDVLRFLVKESQN
jgi:hypothetical protein